MFSMSTTSEIHLHPFDTSASVSSETRDEHPVESGEASGPCLLSEDATDGVPGSIFDKQKQDQSSADEIVRDLDRLAASIRWIQRAEAAARIPQSPTLPPVSRLVPIDASHHLPRAPQLSSVSGLIDAGDGSYRGEMFAACSLKPERLMPPPTVSPELFGPISILIVSVLVAPIAYYLLVGRDGPNSTASVRPQVAAFDSKFIAAPATSLFQESQSTIIARGDALTARAEGEIPPERPLSESKTIAQPTIAQGDALTARAEGEIPPERPLSPTARSSESETVVALQPRTPSAKAPPSGEAIRVLDAEEIEHLIKKGEQFLVAGDVVAARIAFQRAAEAGDGNAAIALGATYDPTELAKLGVVGMRGEVAKARSWYQKAEEFGSPEARARLELLADR